MGTESEKSYTVYLNGEPIAVTRTLPEITVREEGVAESAGVLSCEPIEITGYFKTPKHWRCRSRKRFIKLVMSEGISRNWAEWLADFARALMPYREAWRNVLWRIWTFENRVD